VADVSANFADQRGSYICLMRAKMSDASIARARASSGFQGAPYTVNPRVTISGTDWMLFSLGIIRIPATIREYASFGIIDNAAIIIDAELVSGSGNLEMDCLILIPYNDAYIEADNGGGENLHIMINPDFTSSAFTIPGVKSAALNQNSWGLPANNEAPLLVCAARKLAESTIVNMQLVASIAPRWRTLRGAE
jgi:hypothetical protein